MTLLLTDRTKALNDIFYAEELFKNGVKPNEITSDFNDILYSAILRKSFFEVEKILNYGFSLKEGNRLYEFYAISSKNEKICRLIFQKMKEENISFERTSPLEADNNLLMHALNNKASSEIIAILLKKGISLEWQNSYDENAIHYLMVEPSKFHIELLKFFAKNKSYGKLLEQKNKDGLTPRDIFEEFLKKHKSLNNLDEIKKALCL